jgi:FkbM family methyltransferase
VTTAGLIAGECIRWSPGFRGKARLINAWMNRRDRGGELVRVLPGGGVVQCDLSVPYEAMVWLRQEEEQELRTLRALLRPGDVFVDCGANIGIWTLTAASAVTPGGKVCAFEPGEAAFRKLHRNVRELNRTSEETVRLYNVAVGETAGVLPFSQEDAHNVSHVDCDDAGLSVVPVVALDDVLDAPPQGIKIDVEGFELPALLGARRLLQRERPWICVEFNTLITGVSRLGDWNVHTYLAELGYSGRPFEPASLASSSKPLPQNWTATGYRNLLYTPV